jgi:hypothetical protein
MAATVVRALEQDRDTEAIVVLYDPSEPEPGAGKEMPGADVVAVVRGALRAARIEIRDAYRVSDGRWWSYLCRDPQCCPTEGTEIVAPEQPGGPSTVAATAVHAGMAILPDRASLRQSLEPPAPWTRGATSQALDRVGEGLIARWRAGQQDQVETEVLDLIASLVIRFGRRCPTITDDEAVLVAIGLHDVEVRDTAITWTIGKDAEALQLLLVEVVRRVGPPEHVPAATVLAWCAYLRGNGALASVALELVNETNPNYSLALLIDQMLQGGIHPENLRRTTEQAQQEMRRRSPPRKRESPETAAPDSS